MRYCVVVNVPGYSPIDGSDVDFETVEAARDDLALQLSISREEPHGSEDPRISDDELQQALNLAKVAEPGGAIIFAGYAHTIVETESAQ